MYFFDRLLAVSNALLILLHPSNLFFDNQESQQNISMELPLPGVNCPTTRDGA